MTISQMKRFVHITDEHHPYIINAVYDYDNPKNETPLIKFLKDFQPNILIQGGDQLDLEVVSHWNKGKPRITEGKRLKNDYDTYNTVLDQREKVLKSLESHYMLEGNHDWWIQDTLDKYPEFEGLIEIQTNLHLSQRGIKWIGRRKHVNVGRLSIIHGDYKDGYLPVYAAKAIAQIYGRSIAYGHQHVNQTYSAQTPFDKHPYQVWGIGCLSHVNTEWRRNQPSAWLNSFGYGYVYAGGMFDYKVINIIGDKFIAEGELYK